jgi:hypothetical protein
LGIVYFIITERLVDIEKGLGTDLYKEIGKWTGVYQFCKCLGGTDGVPEVEEVLYKFQLTALALEDSGVTVGQFIVTRIEFYYPCVDG